MGNYIASNTGHFDTSKPRTVLYFKKANTCIKKIQTLWAENVCRNSHLTVKDNYPLCQFLIYQIEATDLIIFMGSDILM